MPPTHKSAKPDVTALRNATIDFLKDRMKSGFLYFYTVTLRPVLYKYASREQFGQTAYLIRNCASKYAKEYGIMPEITKDGNVHYHFWALFDNDTKRFLLLNELKRKRTLGFVKLTPEVIREETNLHRVIDYTLKEYDKTYGVLLCRPHEAANLYNTTVQVTEDKTVQEEADAKALFKILRLGEDLDYKFVDIELNK